MSETVVIKKKLNFSKVVLAIFSLLALFKFYLISREEILALYAPHDEFWYILAASRWVWFSQNYDLMTMIHLPVYPIFIALWHLTGIPLRIGIDLVFILSSFYLTYALRKINASQIICILIFSLIILHPLSFDLFNRTLAETFYTPLLLSFLASLILMWISADKKKLFFSILMGFFAGLLWFTREESVLILGMLALVYLLIAFFAFKEAKDWKQVVKQLKIPILPSLIIISCFTIFIYAANYAKYGLFAPSALNGSDYKSAYTALLKIKPEKTVRFVPITSDTRQKAYSVSPSFRELKPYLENHSNFAYFWTKKEMGIDNEMAAGWFYWMLRDAVSMAGYKTAAEENSFYRRMANEINQGIEEGKVSSRLVPLSFLDPGTFSYLSYFPSSLKKISTLFVETRKSSEASLKDNIFSGQNKIIIDSETNRRAHNINSGSVALNGWAFLKTDRVLKVSLENEAGGVIASTSFFSARPDVQAGYKEGINTIPGEIGFNLEINQPEESLVDTILVFYGENGQIYKAPYAKLNLLKPDQIKSITSDQYLNFAIDQKNVTGNVDGSSLNNRIQDIIWFIYGKIILILSCLGLFSFFVTVYFWKNLNYKEPVYSVLAIMLFAVISRTFLFALLDIGSWNAAQQPRYLFPVMPVYSTFLAVLVYQTYVLIRKKINSK